MHSKPLFLLTFWTTCVLSVFGQYEMTQNSYRQSFIFGLQAIGHQSKIENIETTILSEPFFLNYSMQSAWTKGGGGGMFVNYRGPNFPYVGGQLELSYVRQGGKIQFNNTEKDFHYNMFFKYDYINLNLLSKIYPIDPDNYGAGGLNVGAGLQINFKSSPENIYYQSGGSGAVPAFGTDQEQQQQLRNVLKAKTNLGIVYSVSWELPYKFPVIFDFRYIQGINDVVETYPNSYNFIDNYNNNNVWQIRLSFYLQQRMDQ